MQFIPQEFLAAYQEYDREITIRKTKWGCWLGIVLVPLFGWLDHYAYPQQAVFIFSFAVALFGFDGGALSRSGDKFREKAL